MPKDTHRLINWFDQGGEAYAQFRPDYPPELATFLDSIAPDAGLALDVGCGNGQLTRQLAEHFAAVVGIDPSADQIANAAPHERIRYECAPAERLPLSDSCVSLITAAQAAHWFDLAAFYQEVRRVAVPGGVLALISYGVLELESDLAVRLRRFYCEEIGPYWPPERKLVDDGYRTLEFPFAEFAAPPLQIHRQWTLTELLGYISTWSAVRRAHAAGREDLLQVFADDLADAWGSAERRRPLQWPIKIRIGTV